VQTCLPIQALCVGFPQEDIAQRLEEGLNTSDPVDFEDLLRTKPDEVISYLAEKGTSKLGSFTTEVSWFAHR
jgi:hypothetical protein